MKPRDSKGPPLRRGVLPHVKTGAFTIDEYAMYMTLIPLAEFETGLCLCSAATLASWFDSDRTRTGKALRGLRDDGFILYPNVERRRGEYPIVVIGHERPDGSRVTAKEAADLIVSKMRELGISESQRPPSEVPATAQRGTSEVPEASKFSAQPHAQSPPSEGAVRTQSGTSEVPAINPVQELEDCRPESEENTSEGAVRTQSGTSEVPAIAQSPCIDRAPAVEPAGALGTYDLDLDLDSDSLSPPSRDGGGSEKGRRPKKQPAHERPDVLAVWSHFASRTGSGATLEAWAVKIAARLKRYKPEAIRKAIDTIADDPWWQERPALLRDPEQLFGSDQRLDKKLAKGDTSARPGNGAGDDDNRKTTDAQLEQRAERSVRDYGITLERARRLVRGERFTAEEQSAAFAHNAARQSAGNAARAGGGPGGPAVSGGRLTAPGADGAARRPGGGDAGQG